LQIQQKMQVLFKNVYKNSTNRTRKQLFKNLENLRDYPLAVKMKLNLKQRCGS